MSLGKNWILLIDKMVEKQLKKIPRKEAEHIKMVIKNLSLNPYAGDIEKMKGEENTWRRRIGNYRIFYEIITSKDIIVFSNIVIQHPPC